MTSRPIETVSQLPAAWRRNQAPRLLLGASSLLTVSAMTSLPDRRAPNSRNTRPGRPSRAGSADHRRIRAGVAGAGARQAGRAQRAVHRARRHRLRAARLLRLADRHAEHRSARPERPALHQHAHHGAVLAVALVHPDRPQPSLERDGVHHRRLGRLSRLQRRHPVRERLPLRDPARARLQHLRARQVAPDAGRADQRRRALRSLAARPRLRALLRLPGRRHQPVLPRSGLRQPSGRAAEDARGGLSPDRRIWSTRRSASSPTPSRSRPTSRSSSTSPPARMHAPHHVPKEWADKYKGKFDDGWDAYREKVFAQQKELGIIPPNAELSRHDPDVQDWNKLSADERRLYARMMEVFAGFLEHTDHHIGRLIDFLEAIGELDNTLIMVISDNGASAEGGPTGSVNENKFFNNVPDDLEENLAAIDELGGPKYFNHYPWGWAFAGNTPFRRWKRETYRGGVVRSVHRALAQGHQGQGRDPHAVRARHRHGADRARRARHRAAGGHPRRDPVADPGRQLRAHLRRRQGAVSNHHTQYFEMLGHRVDLSRRLARGVPVPGPRRSPKPRRVSASSSSPRTSCASSMRRAGSSTTSPTIRPRPTTSPARTATS